MQCRNLRDLEELRMAASESQSNENPLSAIQRTQLRVKYPKNQQKPKFANLGGGECLESRCLATAARREDASNE